MPHIGNRVPFLSIIVPTRNSAQTLARLLDSCLHSTYESFEIIVNDSVDSTDDTKNTVERYATLGLNAHYIRQNLSMAQARKSGARGAGGAILLHLDSDMQLSPGLLAECVSQLEDGYDALVIPEQSYGATFWARCKALERATYAGSFLESLRCVRTPIYWAVAGHDEDMLFSEDKDLDLRIRAHGYRVGRTLNCLYHDEGSITLAGILKKKALYANSAHAFAKVHAQDFALQANVFLRFGLYLRNRRMFFRSPVLCSGMIFMKLCEFGVSGLRYGWLRVGDIGLNRWSRLWR